MAILRKQVANASTTHNPDKEADLTQELSKGLSVTTSTDIRNTLTLLVDQLPEYSAREPGENIHEQNSLLLSDEKNSAGEHQQFPVSPQIANSIKQATHANNKAKTGCYLCCHFPNEIATWYWPRRNLYLSHRAAQSLSDKGVLRKKDLQAISMDFDSKAKSSPSDPISGLAVATSHAVYGIIGGAVNVCHINPTQNRIQGISHIILTTLKTPRDFTLALAEGFNNVPHLYGEYDNRPVPQITGLGSGVVAAGKGLSLGLYDGLSGFVLQPINGAKKGGVTGAIKGVGKGVGGLVCSVSAGACGVPAYALQGVHVEIGKAVKSLKERHPRHRVNTVD